jgi:hypothetical protein
LAPHASAWPGVTLAACGESAEEEALAGVCDARASIQSHIEDLEGLRITAATDIESAEAAQLRSTLDAIRSDVGEITDASDELAEDTRQQVEAATDDFRPRLDTAVVRSVGEGGTELVRLIDALARSYEETLASIDCE